MVSTMSGGGVSCGSPTVSAMGAVRPLGKLWGVTPSSSCARRWKDEDGACAMRPGSNGNTSTNQDKTEGQTNRVVLACHRVPKEGEPQRAQRDTKNAKRDRK